MKRSMLIVLVLCFYTTAQAARVSYRTLYRAAQDDVQWAGGVLPSAFSHNGRVFATVASAQGGSQSLRLWNTRTGRRAGTFRIFNVQALAFSSDDRTLAVVTGVRGRYGVNVPYSVQLRDAVSGAVRRTFVKAGKVQTAFYSLAFSPDNKMLAAGSGDGLVRVWNVSTGKQRTTFKHGDFVNGVAFSPDSMFLASGGGDFHASLHLWSLRTRRLVHTASVDEQSPFLAFSPDGKRLMIKGPNRGLSIVDVPTFKVLRYPPPGAGNFDSYSTQMLDFSPHERLMAFVAPDALRVRSLSDGRSIKRFSLRSSVLALRFVGSSRSLLWATYTDSDADDYRITLWHARF